VTRDLVAWVSGLTKQARLNLLTDAISYLLLSPEITRALQSYFSGLYFCQRWGLYRSQITSRLVPTLSSVACCT
jgi:hypothetical protein